MKSIATGTLGALALLLAGCGSQGDEPSGNSAMDAKFTKGEDGGLAIDIGDGTIGTDKDGNASFVGADGVRITVDDNGNATMVGPDGKPVGPGADPKDAPLPLGLTLPPSTSVENRKDSASGTELEGSTMAGFDAGVAHFLKLATSSGMKIASDTGSKDPNSRTIEASGEGGGFKVTVYRQLMNAAGIRMKIRT